MPHPNRLADLFDALQAAGGIASATDLVAASSRGALRSAEARGLITRVARGVYSCPELSPSASPGADRFARSWATWHEPPSPAYLLALQRDVATATGLAGVLSHRSAARQHDWPVLTEPESVEIIVPRSRNSRPERRAAGVRVRWRDVHPDERREGVTAPLRTVLDCAADLPFLEAVAVADSALRSSAVGAHTLLNAADRYRGPCAEQVRAVAAFADGRAENPLESATRVPSARRRARSRATVRHLGFLVLRARRSRRP